MEITETYKKLSHLYLRESRSCLKSKAYRMVILSAVTATHTGVYYRLLLNMKFKQERRIVSFFTIIEKLKTMKEYSGVIDDCNWLMNIRNSVAHPEEILGVKLGNSDTHKIIDRVPDMSDIHKIIDRVPDMPYPKKQIHLASMVNDYKSLRMTAEMALEKSETVLRDLGINIEYGDVIGWKTEEEQELSKLIGRHVDLDHFDSEDHKL